MTTSESSAELRFDPPGPGPWSQDPVHFPRPVTRYFAETHPSSFARGTNDFARFYGMLIDGLHSGYVNGFARQCGQLFQVLDANSRTGQFAARDLPPTDDTTLFLLFYGGADVRFSVSARADFNHDGFLDFFDYDDFVFRFEAGC